jgi:predicted nucleotidyltransferase
VITLIKSIKSFIDQKTGTSEISDGLIYVCQAGSFISGTNDETSDLDFRAVSLLGEDYHVGLKNFDHSKLIAGEGKINSQDDLDVEIFSPRHFIKEAYYGEIIPFEMLHVTQDFRLFENSDIFGPIMSIRELFLSKALVKRYLRFVQSCYKKSLVPVKNLRRPDKIQRAEMYGYESKDAMNAIKCSRLMIELLTTGEVNLYRKDCEELLDIKRGKYTKPEYVAIIEELIKELEAKLQESQRFSDMPNFERVNNFVKKYNLFLYKHFGLI